VLSSRRPHVTVTIDYVPGGTHDPGLDALADALVLMGGSTRLEQALQVAHDLNATLLRQQFRRDMLERQAETLRQRLGLIETELKRSA
jgi:hypothetical protein